MSQPLTPATLNQINIILSSGGIIGFPTDTVYGLACDAFNLSAVDKITQIKGRESSKFYVLQIANHKLLEKLVQPLTNYQKETINKYWPGEITFIFNKSPFASLPYLEETIGIRIPNHKTTLDILASYPNPLVVTSLNRSGEPASTCYDDIPETLKQELDYIVASSEKGSTVASTIVDLSKETPMIIRQGKVLFS